MKFVTVLIFYPISIRVTKKYLQDYMKLKISPRSSKYIDQLSTSDTYLQKVLREQNKNF